MSRNPSGKRSSVRLRYSPHQFGVTAVTLFFVLSPTLKMDKVYFVYIIYSGEFDRYYIGQTENLAQRLDQHMEGKSKYTSRAKDWEIKYVEEFESREAAMKREREIKKKKSRKFIEYLIEKEKGA